jgi:hypothetical protein
VHPRGAKNSCRRHEPTNAHGVSALGKVVGRAPALTPLSVTDASAGPHATPRGGMPIVNAKHQNEDVQHDGCQRASRRRKRELCGQSDVTPGGLVETSTDDETTDARAAHEAEAAGSDRGLGPVRTVAPCLTSAPTEGAVQPRVEAVPVAAGGDNRAEPARSVRDPFLSYRRPILRTDREDV